MSVVAKVGAPILVSAVARSILEVKGVEILEEVISANPLVLEEPAPVIRVSELAESSVNFIVRPWVKTEDYWALYWDLQRAVKEAFDQKGISIPFPQTDMHLHIVDRDATQVESIGEDELALADETRPGAASSFARDDGERDVDNDEERASN